MGREFCVYDFLLNFIRVSSLFIKLEVL